MMMMTLKMKKTKLILKRRPRVTNLEIKMVLIEERIINKNMILSLMIKLMRPFFLMDLGRVIP